MTLEFSVQGTPVPQGSMVARMVKGRAIVVHTKGPQLKAWRKRIGVIARTVAAGRTWGPQEPVRVQLVFGLPRGKSVGRPLPSVKPDLDKLVRSVLDALTESGLIADDSQVTHLAAQKTYSDTPGVLVAIRGAEAPAPRGA